MLTAFGLHVRLAFPYYCFMDSSEWVSCLFHISFSTAVLMFDSVKTCIHSFYGMDVQHEIVARIFTRVYGKDRSYVFLKMFKHSFLREACLSNSNPSCVVIFVFVTNCQKCGHIRSAYNKHYRTVFWLRWKVFP